MIFLNPEIRSGLGEDTFWTWFGREFPNTSFETPRKLQHNDVVLRYSTLGFLPVQGKQIALCWELYPEMKKIFHSNQWDSKIDRVFETARYATYRTVATEYSARHYEQYGSVDVLPIGVNTDVFCVLPEKGALRRKYGLPVERKIGVWIGTTHAMKGFADVIAFANANPDTYWIFIWKWNPESCVVEGAKNFVCIPQEMMNELINAADFFYATSLLKPYYMAEWEAMACNVPFVNVREREFEVCTNPRDCVFEHGWDRKSVKVAWKKYLTEKGIV